MQSVRKYLNSSRKGKFTSQEQLNFLDYLQNSLANGFSLNASLELMPILWPKRRNLIARLSAGVQTGRSLGGAMLKLGFARTITTQIDLAMEQGSLVECLAQLATLIRLKNEQIKKLKAEMSYPIVLAVMMMVLLLFMQSFVSNQFAGTGEHSGDIMLLGLLLLAFLITYYLVRVLGLLKKQDYQSLKRLARYPLVG
ncbi:type II secretion system protein F, partial [Lactobacillus sp. XV13L]|nr:type II secretion system protein F [Lactobacillus sp. XV13L]